MAYPTPSSTTQSSGAVSLHARSMFPLDAPNTAASMAVMSAPSPPSQSAVDADDADASTASEAASSRDSVHLRTDATGRNPAFRYSGWPMSEASSTATVFGPMDSSAALSTMDATPLLR